jgi:hypothetical protein
LFLEDQRDLIILFIIHKIDEEEKVISLKELITYLESKITINYVSNGRDQILTNNLYKSKINVNEILTSDPNQIKSRNAFIEEVDQIIKNNTIIELKSIVNNLLLTFSSSVNLQSNSVTFLIN